jgi:hypothetical protein
MLGVEAAIAMEAPYLFLIHSYRAKMARLVSTVDLVDKIV